MTSRTAIVYDPDRWLGASFAAVLRLYEFASECVADYDALYQRADDFAPDSLLHGVIVIWETRAGAVGRLVRVVHALRRRWEGGIVAIVRKEHIAVLESTGAFGSTNIALTEAGAVSVAGEDSALLSLLDVVLTARGMSRERWTDIESASMIAGPLQVAFGALEKPSVDIRACETIQKLFAQADLQVIGHDLAREGQRLIERDLRALQVRELEQWIGSARDLFGKMRTALCLNA